MKDEGEKREIDEARKKELMEELNVVRNERDERFEKLKVLASAMEKLAKEKEDLQNQVKRREIEILKYSNEISEIDALMQEQLKVLASAIEKLAKEKEDLQNQVKQRDILILKYSNEMIY